MYYQIKCPSHRGEYLIETGEGLLHHHEQWQKLLSGHQVLVVTDLNIAELHLSSLLMGLGDINYHVLKLNINEQTKNQASLDKIYQQLVQLSFTRQDYLIAFGGGVIGDIVGFAAASYYRGIPWIQVPTTLLAQADAAIGGKTAIHYQGIKNALGAIYPPKAVIIDPSVLKTLAEDAYRAGFAELVKYGIACDAVYYAWLTKQTAGLLARDPVVLIEAIHRACQIKADIVARDEFESQGAHGRMQLNFGHTFGHAIEAATNFKTYFHGEAVSIGMVLAAQLSVRYRQFPVEEVIRLTSLLNCLQLPTQLVDLNIQDLWPYVKQDKKRSKAGATFILLDAVGEVTLVQGIGN